MDLLDTNVVSELRRARPHRAVVAWLESVKDEDLHLSAVTIGEIQAGIEITRDVAGPDCRNLQHPEHGRAFRSCARLMHHRPDHLIGDAMIAATAAVHGLTVVTRNTRDFEGLGIRTFNPFDARTD